jgi:hypothetical protein
MTQHRLTERRLLVALLATTMLLGIGKVVWPDLVPVSALTIPAMIGGWRLSVRSLALLGLGILVVLVLEVIRTPYARTALAALVVLLVLALGFYYARLRQQWGLTATQGMPILLDLRARVRALGEPPNLDEGWVLARALRSADDEAFRGDFTLAQRDGDEVQAMVVDVSGHGLSAAGRASQLAGAFGGLVQVLPASQALGACNDYLARQQWDRDYATAVHVVVDQTTGSGQVRCAGHPAPQVRRADGRWLDVAVRGRVLGLAQNSEFQAASVHLSAGDCLVMVTDGALDESAPDPWAGVHDLVARWLDEGGEPGTHALIGHSAEVEDDQTIMVLHRAQPAARR